MSKTKDISDGFFDRLRQVAAKLSTSDSEVQALDMMRVMMSESGCRANAHNNGPPGAPYEKQYHASGLIQFMPATLPGVGWRNGHEAFRLLTAEQQLVYVERFYSPYKGHLHSVGRLYTATFLPAFVKQAGDPSFVLTGKNGPLAWAFGPNAVFDTNGDLTITVGELESAVMRNCNSARWFELEARFSGEGLKEEPSTSQDLGTVLGLQCALAGMNIDPGPLDGIFGRRTKEALMRFQELAGLKIDGIYGPKTRAALEKYL